MNDSIKQFFFNGWYQAFIPGIGRPDAQSDVKSKMQYLDKKQTTQAQEIHKTEQEEGTKKLLAEIENTKRRAEIQKQYEKLRETKIAQVNDLVSDHTKDALRTFMKILLKKYFTSKFTTDVDKSLEEFVKISFQTIYDEIVQKNLESAEQEKKKGKTNVRPQFYFIEATFYKNIINDCFKHIFEGKIPIADGYQHVAIDNVTEDGLKNMKIINKFD